MLVLEAVRVDRLCVTGSSDRIVDRVEEVDRVAVALRGGVGVVQVGGDLGDAEACGIVTDGRWLWNRTRIGSPYFAWISGPGTWPSNAQTVVGA